MNDDNITDFVPGLTLSRLFYEQAVIPILRDSVPSVEYAAALIGSGSEVLGFDTPQSTDHHWGPRVMLFLGERDHAEVADEVTRTLSERLPHTFMGYPTNFGPPDDGGVRLLLPIDRRPVDHRADVESVPQFFSAYLGWDGSADPTPEQWLTFSEHKLRSVTGGAVFHDPEGVLSRIREQLAWYPDDVWRYVMAAEWNHIADEEAFVGRCGDVGDEIGSRLIASRIMESLMRLCFLLERVYPPYSKWFGTAFGALACAAEVEPLIVAVLGAEHWHKREAALAAAYVAVATLHNAALITEPIEPCVSSYYDRPYQVIHAHRFADALIASIDDARIRSLPVALGSVNQWVSSSNTREQRDFREAFQSMYGS